MTVLYALRQNSQQHAAHPMVYFTVHKLYSTPTQWYSTVHSTSSFDNGFFSVFFLIKELTVHSIVHL